MIKLPTKIATVFSVIAFISIAATTVSAKNDLSAFQCGCSNSVKLDLSLPISHPANRCAQIQETPDVSWIDWLIGKTTSNQFHYLNLLELLSRHTEQKYRDHS